MWVMVRADLGTYPIKLSFENNNKENYQTHS